MVSGKECQFLAHERPGVGPRGTPGAAAPFGAKESGPRRASRAAPRAGRRPRLRSRRFNTVAWEAFTLTATAPAALFAHLAPLIATGIAVGLLSGTFGVGGGVLAVPALTFLLHIDQHIAQGTSLATMVPTTAFGAYRYARAGHLRWPAAARLGIAALVCALLSAHLSLALPARVLRLIFAAFVAFLAIRTATADRRRGQDEGAAGARTPSPHIPLAIGVAAGIPSGLLGVGIGSIANPLLVLLSGLPQQVAQGTTLAAMTLSSLSGLSQYAAAGMVDWAAAGILFAGAIIAVPAGTAIAHRLPEPALRRAFTVFLSVIAVLEVVHAV